MAVIIDEVLAEATAPAATPRPPVAAQPTDTAPQTREVLAAHARAQARAHRLTAE